MGSTSGQDEGRGNEAWRRELRAAGPEGEAARRDLRALLVAGLGRAFGARAGAQVEDFAQEALVRVLDRLDAFRGDSRFTTWAMSIAVHVAHSELRRAHWKGTSLEDLAAYDEAGALLPEGAPDAERSLARARALAALEGALGQITDRQRAVIAGELRGMPQEEIGRRLGVGRNAVYKLGHDARRALLRALVAEGLGADDVRWAFSGEEGGAP
ncbi:MAG TPA: sigma-70 family RNA polymerase sigma factor [Polyangiaceae bacterium]|nr:sigma-70 family RNA polymerase sigma factor [Polyangiaceae bacterium]